VVRGEISFSVALMNLEVLFEDNHCLAVAKPAGLLTQGVPAGIDTLESAARDYLKTKYHKSGNVYLGIPHRLDRPVSGVVLFARSSKAAARLAEQFRDHIVVKVYWSLLEISAGGELPPEKGVWEDWLLRSKTNRAPCASRRTPPGQNGPSSNSAGWR
jgi:23S rRNA pseudouridine1911/1915/1917 synthase